MKISVDLKTGQFSPSNMSGKTYAWSSSENVGGIPMIFGGFDDRKQAQALDKEEGKLSENIAFFKAQRLTV